MKKLLFSILSLAIFLPNFVFAVNTYSVDLQKASSQYGYILQADQTFSITGSFTAEVWYKPHSQPSTNTCQYLFSKWDVSTANRAFIFQYCDTGGTNYLKMWISSNGADQTSEQVAYSLTTDEWTHLALTFSSSTQITKFYVNGSQQGAVQPTAYSSVYDASTTLAVGNYYVGATVYTDGLVDEARMYNKERSSLEIAGDYNTDADTDDPNLLLYLKLENDWIDSSPNGNDFTAVNSPNFTLDVPFPTATDNSAFLTFSNSMDNRILIILGMGIFGVLMVDLIRRLFQFGQRI